MTLSPSTAMGEAGTSPSVRRPVRRRLSLSHILIGLVVVLAFVLNVLALQDRTSSTLVAVADRPLALGSVFDASSVRLVPVPTDFEGLDSLITDSEVAALDGWVLERGVLAGGLIDVTVLVEPGAPSGLRSMSIPIAPEHAAGGTISAGDRIDVISVNDGVAEYVVAGVEVIGISDSDSGSLRGSSDYHVVVAVDDQQALALAVAIDTDSIELIRSTGAPDVVVEDSTGGS